MPTLDAPLTLPCGQTLPNRLAKAAMSEQLGDRDGHPTRDLVRLYERWGRSGAGLLLTGNVMVDRRQIGEPRNVVVDDRRDLPLLTEWATAAQAHGARAWVQVNHPGRQAIPDPRQRPVAPSPVATRLPGWLTPRELTESDIEQIVAAFARAATVVQDAGFDGVQIHAAHGYLISQFLSPLANRRTDAWGGSIANRARFLLAVTSAVRAAVRPGFAVSVKLNSADFQRGGLTEDEALEVLAELADLGVDLLEISGGTYEKAAMFGDAAKDSTRRREAYFMAFAERARDAAGAMPLMLTGGFRTRDGMEEAVASGAIDVVGLARPMAVVPDLPKHLDAPVAAPQRLPIGPLANFVELYWYTRQLHRLGAGRNPDPCEPAWRTAGHAVMGNGWQLLRRRRA